MAEVRISNQNLSYPDMLRGARRHDQILRQVGADAYLWSVVRGRVGVGRQLARQGLIGGLQESWRDQSLTQTVRGVIDGKAGIKDMAISVAFPLLDRSHKPLRQIAREVPESKQGEVGLIVHPPGQHLGGRPPNRPREYNDLATFHGPLLFQLSVEHMRSLGINPHASAEATAQALGEFQEESGFQAVADTNHLAMMRNGERIDLARAQDLVHCMAKTGLLHEVQLDVQPDFGADPTTIKNMLADGLATTPQGEIFEAAVRAWPTAKPLVATVEMPYSAMKPHGGYKALEQVVTQVRDALPPGV